MKNLYTKDVDLEILQRQRGKIDPIFIQKLGSGDLRAMDGVLRHRVQINAASGVKKLLLSTNDKVVGVSDFAGNKLPEREVFLTKQIRIGYDYSTEEGQEALLEYSKAFTPSWKSAELKISQAGKQVLHLPISDLIITGVADNADDRYINLELPYALVGLKTNEIEVEFPDGSSPKVISGTTQKEYLEIVQKGTLYVENV